MNAPASTWAEAFRTSTFRNAALASGLFAAGTAALFAFIYWQTALYEAEQIDQNVLHEAAAISREPPQDIARDVAARFAGDLHRQTFAALLAPDRTVAVGDLAFYPPHLPADGRLHITDAARLTETGSVIERVSITARLLPDGRTLVVGRSRRELARLTLLVGRALALGLVPALLLALALGLWASFRSSARIAVFRATLDRVMEGALDERLPAPTKYDTLDILAASVNRMLDKLEHLLAEMRNTGNHIAHDLRTPLARMRARLEGGRRRSTTLEELDEAAAAAIADLDQCFSIVTALLRIAELESVARKSGFATVNLRDIVEELADLYQPMAELRNQSFTTAAIPCEPVLGDRDLLFEMGANLLDNAIKFTPEGGHVALMLSVDSGQPVLRVADSGRGIPPGEREAVLRRFYRSDTSGSISGTGLGLSLVAAILDLHGLSLAMRDVQGGFAVEVRFRAAGPAADAVRPG